MCEAESLEQSYLGYSFERARELQNMLDATNDESKINELSVEYLPNINYHFPYYNKSVYMCGMFIGRVIDEEGEEIDASVFAENMQGTHLGFQVIDVSGDDDSINPQVVQKLLVKEEISGVTVETRTRRYNFFELESLILPNTEMESILAAYEGDDDNEFRLENLTAASKYCVNLLRSTEFRRLKHRQQRRTIDNLLFELNKQITVRDMKFMGEPEYAYMPFVEGGLRGFEALDVGAVMLGGKCLGVDLLEAALLGYGPIRRDNDMADRDAGLCLVVETDFETSQQLGLNDSRVLYIPTNDQKFDSLLYGE